tara:strand:+ start:1375 stop:2115 length:741 start_codon:yes stop_codon:yes gene_type:complete
VTISLPEVYYHRLDSLIQRNELDLVLTVAAQALNRGDITKIVNAFFVNTKICINGIPYIKINGLSEILRTGNSGAERPLIYQGIPGILSAAEVVEIDGEEHVSGPSLTALIETRKLLKAGRTKEYLSIAMQSYHRILSLAEVRDLKDVFLEDIRTRRPLLKTQRIAEFNISCCEFTGQQFPNNQSVEFAHIDSVALNPMLALDINNGVIILKEIHRELTRLGIHDFAGMYGFCQDNGYSTAWSDNI